MNRVNNKTQLLKDALFLLENVVWVQGDLRKLDYDTGKPIGYCLVGALDNISQYHAEAYHRVLKVIPTSFLSLIDFNDAPSTTKKMVLQVLDTAIGKDTEET